MVLLANGPLSRTNNPLGAEDLLLRILSEQIQSGQLRLPSLPEVALRVRDIADDPKSNLQQIAAVVARDPVLSLRLIRLANTAHYARSAKVTTVLGAAHRIGLRAIRNIAIAMALEQLFLVQSPIVRHYMEQAWLRAITACAAATALFNHCTPTLSDASHQGGLHVENVTLLALTHNIGLLPILAEAERHDDIFANPSFLERAFMHHGGEIAAAIFAHWQFDSALIDASRHWRNLHLQPAAIDYIDFIRLGALKAGEFEPQEQQEIWRLARQRGLIDEGDPFALATVCSQMNAMLAAFE